MPRYSPVAKTRDVLDEPRVHHATELERRGLIGELPPGQATRREQATQLRPAPPGCGRSLVKSTSSRAPELHPEYGCDAVLAAGLPEGKGRRGSIHVRETQRRHAPPPPPPRRGRLDLGCRSVGSGKCGRGARVEGLRTKQHKMLARHSDALLTTTCESIGVPDAPRHFRVATTRGDVARRNWPACYPARLRVSRVRPRGARRRNRGADLGATRMRFAASTRRSSPLRPTTSPTSHSPTPKTSPCYRPTART